MTELKGKVTMSALKRGVAAFLAVCLCVTMVQTDIFAAGVSSVGMTLGEQTPGEQTPGEQTPGEQTPGEQPVEVKSITLSKASAILVKGETVVLTATVIPADAENKAITWTTSNAAVAIVSNGTVKAVGAGTATITASTANGVKAECKVTVKNPEVSKVTLSKTTATIVKGKSLTLTATITPADAADKSIKWSSSNSKVATVSNGTVKAKKAGTATITATTVNGKKATCKVTVAEVTFNAKETVVQVGKTSSAVKIASKYPSKDTVKSYSSSNKKIVTVDKKGKIKGIKAGKATITVTMKSGSTASYKVTVQKGKVVTKSLKMSISKVTVLKGKTAKLSFTRNPISATEKITWKTSNKKIATVDKNGKVTAKAPGKVTITAKSANGKKTTCKVTVPGVTLKNAKASIKVKKTCKIQIKSTVVKKDKVASYTVKNKKIVKVSSKGVVTGLKKGTTTITVKMKSGATTTFKVTVK